MSSFRFIVFLALIIFAGCATSQSKAGVRTLDDEIAIHGTQFVVEFDGYNRERQRHEKGITWYKKGVGTHIVQAYESKGRWIVFQVNDEKDGSKW